MLLVPDTRDPGAGHTTKLVNTLLHWLKACQYPFESAQGDAMNTTNIRVMTLFEHNQHVRHDFIRTQPTRVMTLFEHNQHAS